MTGIGTDSVRAYVENQEVESETLEFKGYLPAKDKRTDPWYEGKGGISEFARDRILGEVVGFANAFGGRLLLGIEEEPGVKPARAIRISPVPRCADLADRLMHQARDGIEPRLPRLAIEGVPTEEDGSSGVVVIDVERSYLAPHRLRYDRQCYFRRGTSSEPMNMREIQDLTLRTERGTADLREAFGERAAIFQEWLERGTDVVGARITAMPVWPIAVDRVRREWVCEPRSGSLEWATEKGGVRHFDIFFPLDLGTPHPMLRGYARDGHGDLVRQELRDDGLCEVRFAQVQELAPKKPSIHQEWVLGAARMVLSMVEKFRDHAGSGPVEFALQLEIGRAGKKGGIAVGDPHSGIRTSFRTAAPAVAPPLSVGDASEFGEVLGLVWRDLRGLIGREPVVHAGFRLRS